MRFYYIPACFLLIAPLELAAENTIKAAIGLNSSQLIEELDQEAELSFMPIEGSIIPLINTQPIDLGRIYDDGKNWQRHINQPVKVINRQNQKAYEGRLLRSNRELFELLVAGQVMQLHLSDYNLVMDYQAAKLTPLFTLNDKFTYQTYDLSWQPQLSIFLDDEYAVLKQSALIQNASYKDLELAHPILQLKQSHHVPQPSMKMARGLQMSDMATESSGVDYVKNEITVPTNQDIRLGARQTLLFPFKEQKLKLNKIRSVAELYPNPRSKAQQGIQFEQRADLILEQDAMPGNYQTYWQYKDYLLPAGITQLEHLRQGNQVTLKINQSQDIKAELTLVEASSLKLPATQTWQLSVSNLSNQNQNIDVFHNANGLIEDYQDLSKLPLTQLEMRSAHRLKLSYQLVPNEKIKIQYKLSLTH